MAKKIPITKTYKFYCGIDNWFRADAPLRSLSICKDAMQRMFELTNRPKSIELVVSNVRPKDDNFHFMRDRHGEYFITGLSDEANYGTSTQYVPWACRETILEDFGSLPKTLYLWCR